MNHFSVVLTRQSWKWGQWGLRGHCWMRKLSLPLTAWAFFFTEWALRCVLIEIMIAYHDFANPYSLPAPHPESNRYLSLSAYYAWPAHQLEWIIFWVDGRKVHVYYTPYLYSFTHPFNHSRHSKFHMVLVQLVFYFIQEGGKFIPELEDQDGHPTESKVCFTLFHCIL